MEEDAQPITQPMIATAKSKDFDIREKEMPKTSFQYDYLAALMLNQKLIRNVAVVGALHHGKTGLMDLFIQQTHIRDWDGDKEYHYTDARKDEQKRKMTIKSSPMSLLLPDSKDKSYLINLLDTPGHPNFMGEVCSSLRMCDGAILVGTQPFPQLLFLSF